MTRVILTHSRGEEKPSGIAPGAHAMGIISPTSTSVEGTAMFEPIDVVIVGLLMCAPVGYLLFAIFTGS